MDSDFWLHSLTGGAIITATLTLARLVLEYTLRTQQHDAETRLERILQDRLAEADRRYEAERERSSVLEEELRRVNCGCRDTRR
jgi:hypothetical protein